MGGYSEFYAAIDEIRRLLSRDLIGPITPDEVIESVDPLSYYAMGILWAKRLNYNDDTEYAAWIDDMPLETDLTEDVEDPLEVNDSITEANTYKPSAMGLSVMLPAEAGSLNVRFSFGEYVHSRREEIIKDKESGEEKTISVIRYSRTPRNLETVFTVPDTCKSVFCAQHSDFHAIGVDITLTVRKALSDGSKLVTVSVSNAIETPQIKKEQNENAMFQCELKISSSAGFLPVYQGSALGQSEEEQITSMLYRNVLNYAYGHGCAVRYSGEADSITEVSSDFMPSEVVLQMMPGQIREAEVLKLDFWRAGARRAACEKLLNFVSEYEEWSAKQANLAKTLTDCHTTAKTVLNRIETCICRLRRGIDVLRENDTAWAAFLLMNEAMLLQRVKTKKLPEAEHGKISWYPFQLAYILQIIPDITEHDSAFRNSVDLLWFPTGGGKTEAYLGVAAFTIFLRRLSAKPINDGVTVIMRYTLRLLTIQQFERASALVCACEHLRRDRNIPGGEISIGLWIGSGMTPNHIEGEDGAAAILKKLRENPDERINEGNPVQITNCPWCGESIDLDGYQIAGNHLVIKCSNNPRCEFHSALPIYLVDDDVYMKRPTLVLSTIDKFARIAWELKSKSLFGEDCAPPELIIQDELHLISGPLGSLAGVYEIAVEYLSTCNGRYPKIIASTATVKNAVEQIRNLYNKEALQFPPSGLNFDDSFFAVGASRSERPARTYVGLCETGGSLADLMIRVYSNLLFAKAYFIKQGKPNEIIDQFSTIIGYFNALKDLGKTDNIIRDRVYSNIRTLAERKFKAECDAVGMTTSDVKTGLQEELTSRKSSKEIKETLGRLDLPYTDPAHYSIVLASNMLSVGIDINRLGLMTVYNQPKSNAEYIQATSRVGRQNPGLVLAMYNTARSRDKSHYEQFGYYHRAFYQYVEATSVTPFSSRSVEKALHCVFIAMLRLTVDMYGHNDHAAKFRANDTAVSKVTEYILSRIQAVRPDAVGLARNYLDKVCNDWEYLAKENPDTLVYSGHTENKVSLLQAAEQSALLDFPLVLNSLRNVEESSNVFIAERDV
ncbi:DNA helicase [Synergistales bacterium]|nr:DNA helicase [Synergistales bacterium]